MGLVWFDLQLYILLRGEGWGGLDGGGVVDWTETTGLVKFTSAALILSTFSCFEIIF